MYTRCNHDTEKSASSQENSFTATMILTSIVLGGGFGPGRWEVAASQWPLYCCCDLLSRLRSPHLRVIALAPLALGHRLGDSRLPGGVVAVSE
jgi:hypothetical protein